MFFLVDLDKAIFNNHCISAINTSIISKYYVLRETDFSAEKLFSGGSDSDDGRDDNVNGALGKCARKLGKALLLADNLMFSTFDKVLSSIVSRVPDINILFTIETYCISFIF